MDQKLKINKSSVLSLIDIVDNFPKEKVKFYDLSPILRNPDYLKWITKKFKRFIKEKNIDVIVAPESRGFLFALPLAIMMNIPFVMIRKENKLPKEKFHYEYDLEYGSGVLELQKADIKPGQRVAVVDDVLATGGTILACKNLIEQAKATVVANMFVLELKKLKGRKHIDADISFSLLKV